LPGGRREIKFSEKQEEAKLDRLGGVEKLGGQSKTKKRKVIPLGTGHLGAHKGRLGLVNGWKKRKGRIT